MSKYRSVMASDYARLRPGSRFSLTRFVLTAATNPGLFAVSLLRVQMALVERRLFRTAGLVRSVCLAITGADFVPGCHIGTGLLIHHPVGIVIGAGAIVGRGATILQHVTLGEKFADGREPHDYPHVGDNCTLGAGARILGGVRLGDGAQVGANAVVVKDVPAGALAVGVPARIVGSRRG